MYNNSYNWHLFHTYCDFRIKSIAWKTHTEISWPNHNRKTTFSHAGKAFHPIRNQLSKWISQYGSALSLLLAHLQSSFTEVCRVCTSLLKFSRKLAINHRQKGLFPPVALTKGKALGTRLALDKPIKKYIQEEQKKETRTKTRRGEFKGLTPARRTIHWSPLHGLPYGLPLVINQIPFMG